MNPFESPQTKSLPKEKPKRERHRNRRLERVGSFQIAIFAFIVVYGFLRIIGFDF